MKKSPSHVRTLTKRKKQSDYKRSNLFCPAISGTEKKFFLMKMLPRDGSLVPPDVGDHDEQGWPEHDRHHDVVEPEPVADVLLQAEGGFYQAWVR
jgi:hypothetical protein